MQTRLIQLATRYIGMGLVAAATLIIGEPSPEQAEAINISAQGIAAGLGGVVFLIADALIHKAETGGVMKPAGTSKST